MKVVAFLPHQPFSSSFHKNEQKDRASIHHHLRCSLNVKTLLVKQEYPFPYNHGDIVTSFSNGNAYLQPTAKLKNIKKPDFQ